MFSKGGLEISDAADHDDNSGLPSDELNVVCSE
jgi:hypothetical protein